ncbi:MAG: hypothetical protein K2Q22_14805 [Cytophagales bacterium]|nr:hypothetical protein [Cytophagales bacterium]
MRKLLFFILMSIASQSYSQITDSTYGNPLIVLTETNPWLSVIGSDIPSFALYENGQIIYKTFDNNKTEFHEVKLSKKSLNEVIKSFSIPSTIYALKDHYDVSESTDEPSYYLF